MSTSQRPRVLYFADGGLLVYDLWDPFSPDQLVAYVDRFADNGVDVLSQMVFTGGTTKPGLFVPEHPDLVWWQHERFGDLIRSGIQPLDILIGRAHERGLRLFAKLRMSDWHEHPPEAQPFVTAHPEWHNPSWSARPVLDYTHDAVRAFHLAVVDELLRRFDVDGITLNFIRGWYCFPKETGREQHGVLTEFVRQVRQRLDAHGARRGRRLELSVIVLPALDLCQALGYDVPTWVREGLVDYLSCGNGQFSDPNQDHEPWATLCADSGCRYHPLLHSGISETDRVGLCRVEHLRAVARGMYAGGADGFGVFNWVYYWARRGGLARYPGPVSGQVTALDAMRRLRDPDAADDGPRHYLYRPLGMAWEADGHTWEDACRVTFPRRPGSQGRYRIRLPEDLTACGGCELFVHVLGLCSEGREPDAYALSINGERIPPRSVRRAFHGEGRLERFGAPLPPYTSLWFPLTAPPARCGENVLSLELTACSAGGASSVTIEEVEAVVLPRTVDRPQSEGGEVR